MWLVLSLATAPVDRLSSLKRWPSLLLVAIHGQHVWLACRCLWPATILRLGVVVGSTAIVPIVELGVVVAPATVATVLMVLVILAALEMVIVASLGLLLPLTIVLVVVVPLLVPAIGSLLSVLLGLHFDFFRCLKLTLESWL